MHVLLCYEEESCICGCHLYQSIWTAEVGESLICEREPFKSSDRYVVAVLKDNVVVGHLPNFVIVYIQNGTIY